MTPTSFFNGNTADVLAFYANLFGIEPQASYFRDELGYEGTALADKVLHPELHFDDSTVLMICDAPASSTGLGSAISLTWTT